MKLFSYENTTKTHVCVCILTEKDTRRENHRIFGGIYVNILSAKELLLFSHLYAFFMYKNISETIGAQ